MKWGKSRKVKKTQNMFVGTIEIVYYIKSCILDKIKRFIYLYIVYINCVHRFLSEIVLLIVCRPNSAFSKLSNSNNLLKFYHGSVGTTAAAAAAELSSLI